MLVETMTPKEMMEELRREYKYVNDDCARFIDNGGVRNLRRPKAKFPAYIYREIKTPRGNRMLCTMLFNKRGDVFKDKAALTVSAVMQTKEGLAALAIVYSGRFNKEIMYIYRPHMFKRYKERLGLDIDGIELIRHFDIRNGDTITHEGYKHKEGDIEHDIMLTSQDGALFGTEHTEGSTTWYVINTFIANDTMQEGYKSKFNLVHNDAIDELKFFKDIPDHYPAEFKKRKE